ncbi:MAG: isoleucine--tRNA ligase, partial [Bacteroidales bacterium]|nr:isoleucine--tRNA ligase [Bacteroidales bacterium]
TGECRFTIEEQEVVLQAEDVEISTEDIPGWVVATSDRLTVALDTHVTPELRREGIARELVNRIQNLRKETNLAVTDRIRVSLTAHEELQEVLESHREYICNETLSTSMDLVEGLQNGTAIELTDTLKVCVELAKA